MNKIGDVKVLQDDSGIRNLTIFEAVTMVGSMQGMPVAPVEDPSVGLKELSSGIAGIDRNVAKTCRQLKDKIRH